MNRDDDAAGPASLAGLSELGEPRVPDNGARHPFAVADEQRYRELRVVGAGGRGTVLLAHDARLGRDVALKRIGPGLDEGDATERFAHEARITAGLDHPGIVPIHDAGMTDDGRPYYTMRLIRGRSLAELAAEAPSLAARLALTTSVTAAAHAVGHAHRAGVVHRDLKPANIMVGELGETQVVDWGLAETTAVAAAAAPYVGTPAYLSPEAAHGDGVTPASDVWALGVVLFELVTGERRWTGTKDAILSALRTRSLPAAQWPDTCPSELRAIGDKAMAPDPASRYADAQALAADLEAFRDGRRVGAHQYSTLELARRLVSAWRWPLAVTGALVIATIASLALTAYRTEHQRERAVAAEARATSARSRAEAALGWALAASSVAALEARHDARAEVLAAHALVHDELPDARGVLAATRAGAHPDRSTRIVIPGCEWVVAASYDIALCVAPTHVELWELEPLRRRWRRDLTLDGAIDLDEKWVIGWRTTGELQVLDATTGAEHARHHELTGVAQMVRNWERTRVGLHDRKTLVVVDVATGTPQVIGRICGERTIDAVAVGARDAWAVCSGGELVRMSAAGVAQPYRETGFGTVRRPASALALSEPETDLVIGGVGGDVMMIDLRGCFSEQCAGLDPVTLMPGVTTHAIQHVACLGNEAMVIADSGDAVQVRRGVGAELMRVPVHDGRAATFLEGDIAVGGAQWRLWRFPLQLVPRQFSTRPGLTIGAVAADGQLVAAGNEDGATVVWSTVHGGVVATLRAEGGPVTTLAFSANGTQLTAGTRVYETTSWTEQTSAPALPLPATPAHGKTIVTAGPHRAVVRDARGAGEVTIEVRDAEILDLALGEDGRWLAVATTSGVIEVWAATTGKLAARLRGHRQRATWVELRGDVLWSAGWDGQVLRWDLRALDTPAVDLVRAIEAQWGLTLDDVLGIRKES